MPCNHAGSSSFEPRSPWPPFVCFPSVSLQLPPCREAFISSSPLARPTAASSPLPVCPLISPALAEPEVIWEDPDFAPVAPNQSSRPCSHWRGTPSSSMSKASPSMAFASLTRAARPGFRRPPLPRIANGIYRVPASHLWLFGARPPELGQPLLRAHLRLQCPWRVKTTAYAPAMNPNPLQPPRTGRHSPGSNPATPSRNRLGPPGLPWALTQTFAHTLGYVALLGRPFLEKPEVSNRLLLATVVLLPAGAFALAVARRYAQAAAFGLAVLPAGAFLAGGGLYPPIQILAWLIRFRSSRALALMIETYTRLALYGSLFILAAAALGAVLGPQGDSLSGSPRLCPLGDTD